MRLALPTFLALSVLPAATARRHHRGAVVAKGQDRQVRRQAKADAEKGHYRVGDLRVQVSNKSGEISLSRGKMGKKKNKESTVKILIESIEEVDAEGNAVGEGEAEAHSISLKDTEFEIFVEEYDVPVAIEDDADGLETVANGTVGLTDEEAHNDVDIVDEADEEGEETGEETGGDGDATSAAAAEEEADDSSAVAAAGSVAGDAPEAAPPQVLLPVKEDSVATPHTDVFCAGDVRDCPDGSQVRRDDANGCAFAPCPGSRRRRLRDGEDAAAAPPPSEEGEGGAAPAGPPGGAEDGDAPDASGAAAEEGPSDAGDGASAADAPAAPGGTPAADDGGAEGTNVTLSAALPQTEGGDLRVETLLISRGGAVGTTGETWAVLPGDMKFNLQLTRWSFCDPCANGTETGAFVDVRLQIQGKRAGGPKRKDRGARIETAADAPTGGPGKEKGGAADEDDTGRHQGKKKRREEHAWDLGEGATLDLTSRVRVDGVWTDMPAGYPKLVTDEGGGRQHYTLRFPRFNDTVWYDPVVTFDEEFDAYADASAAPASRLAARLAAGAGAFLAGVLLS